VIDMTTVTPAPPPLPPPPAPPAPDRHPAGGRPARPPSTVFRVALVVVGGAITLFLLAVGTFTVADSLGRTTETTSLSFAGPVRHVNVSMHSGRLVIRGTDREDVRGERRVTHGLQTPTWRESVDGDTLTISGGCPILTGVWCDVSYTIDVPAGVTIDAENGAGSIDASGLSGDLRLRSGAGSVTIDDVSGKLDLMSGAGSVQATRVRSSTVVAESGAGSVDLIFIAAPDLVRAQAGAGSVDIEVPRDGAPYDVSSMGKSHREDVEIATDPASKRTIDAEAGAGSVYVHYPVL
jgi:hypothetical protein